MRQSTKDLRKHEVMTFSVRDCEVFVAALLNPPAPSPRLRKAVERYQKHQHRSINAQ
jgi:uncharacterized protein (DUF1778 family)